MPVNSMATLFESSCTLLIGLTSHLAMKRSKINVLLKKRRMKIIAFKWRFFLYSFFVKMDSDKRITAQVNGEIRNENNFESVKNMFVI